MDVDYFFPAGNVLQYSSNLLPNATCQLVLINCNTAGLYWVFLDNWKYFRSKDP